MSAIPLLKKRPGNLVLVQSPIFYAARESADALMDCLLKSPLYDKKNPTTIGGRTALHEATMKRSLTIVKNICLHTKTHNPPDDHGYTPLHLASAKGFIEIVEFILEQITETSIPTSEVTDCQTPLHMAAKFNRLEVLKLLIRKDKNPNYKTKSGKSAFDLAMEKGHKKVAEFLMLFQGWNLLHYAAREGRIEVFKFNHYYLNEPLDDLGYSPLHVAAEYGNLDIVQFAANSDNVCGKITGLTLKTSVVPDLESFMEKEDNTPIMDFIASENASPSITSTFSYLDSINGHKSMLTQAEELFQEIKSG